MASIADILGSKKTDQLMEYANRGYTIQRQGEPRKDARLHEDNRWIDYHNEYMDDAKRIFRLAMMKAARENMRIFVYPQCPLLLQAHIHDAFPHKEMYCLGWHINVTLIRTPVVFMRDVDLLNIASEVDVRFDQFDFRYQKFYRRAGRQSIQDQADFMAAKLPWDKAEFTGDFPYFRVRDFDMPVLGDGSWIPEEHLFGFIKDFIGYKYKVFNMRYPLSNSMMVDGKVYYGMPMVPKGLWDSFSNANESVGEPVPNRTFWSFI